MIKDKHIVVNYHYVQDPTPGSPGIFPCSVGEFERQVKFLADSYKITSVPEVFEAARSNSKERLAAVTFDDGLKGQYRYAAPILEKYKATGTFFPITSAFDGRLPVAHKVHILLSRLSVDDCIDFFNKYLFRFYPDLRDHYNIPKDRRLTDKRLHEDVGSANLKEALIILPDDIKGRFLRHTFKTFKLDEKKIAADLFMSREEVVDLKDRGMAIGNHSHSHYTFDTISEEVMENEIELAGKTLGEMLGDTPRVFSYPHGRHNELSKNVLARRGFQYALTIEKRAVRAEDDPLKIPRYDTNNLIKPTQQF